MKAQSTTVNTNILTVTESKTSHKYSDNSYKKKYHARLSCYKLAAAFCLLMPIGFVHWADIALVLRQIAFPMQLEV